MLTATQIQKTQAQSKPIKLRDGDGMYLLITPSGGKLWRLNYRFRGKYKTLALGSYPEISLADARDRLRAARKILANGDDPGEQKKKDKRAAIAQYENTFENLARELHAIKSPTWTTGHSKQWLQNLEKHAFPKLGNRALDDIEPPEILEIMRGLEADGTFEKRDRLLQTISSTFKYAMATGRAKSNPADIKIALKDRPPTVSFACISTSEIPEFIGAFNEYKDSPKVSKISIAAFKLLLHTAVRSSELRFAKWVDFDLKNKMWTIPPEQMGRKGKQGRRRPHHVPLSTQSITILENLRQMTGGFEYAFPSRNGADRVISENTINKMIEGMGYKGRQTGHGFRALIKTWLTEKKEYRGINEAVLSHAIAENATEGAYLRTTLYHERIRIMREWSDHLSKCGL